MSIVYCVDLPRVQSTLISGGYKGKCMAHILAATAGPICANTERKKGNLFATHVSHSCPLILSPSLVS